VTVEILTGDAEATLRTGPAQLALTTDKEAGQ